MPFYKKKDKKLRRNYRVVLRVLNIFRRILRNIFEEEYEEMEGQTDFSAGRSCVDNIFVLRLIWKNRETREEISRLKRAFICGS